VKQLPKTLLRVHPEPFEYIVEDEIHSILVEDPARYLSHLESDLKDIASGKATIIMPKKQIFEDHDSKGDFRVMPCIVKSPKGTLKTVKIVGTNVTNTVVPDQITVGKAFCLNPKDNFISHILEACLLSSARTGACSALARKLLAPDSSKIVIAGSGRVGFYAALYNIAVGRVSEITFTDTEFDRAEKLANKAASLWPDIKINAAPNKKSVSCDTLILATDSRKPLFTPSDVTAELVISLGADTTNQSELATSWSEYVNKIYVDSMDAMHVGDLKLWSESGKNLHHDYIDIISLLKGARHAMNEGTKLFISTGMALLDNLTIGFILQERSKFARQSSPIG